MNIIKARTSMRKLIYFFLVTNSVLSLVMCGLIVLSFYMNWERTVQKKESYYNTLTGAIIEHYYKQNEYCSFATVKAILKAVDELTPKYFPEGPFTSDDLLAIVALESSFNPTLIGSHGERGCFQILAWKETLKMIDEPLASPIDPVVNTKMGLFILKEKYAWKKTYKDSIIAYNGYIVKDGKVQEKYWNTFNAAKNLIRMLKVNAKEI